MFNHLDLSAPSTNTQNGQPAPSNFEIAGIILAEGQFEKIAEKMGTAPIVERGDGANHRVQACYSPLDKSQNVHLVFERDGEGFGSSFYLFEDGSRWDGIDLCVGSPLISTRLHTASGLHLGETQAQVRSILGKPSTASLGKLTYVYETQKKASVENAYIEARFVNSKLMYLGVTRSETSP
jgi:hypothetical protein